MSNNPVKESYTEAEAAAALGTTVAGLRMLLDEHIFNDGTPRPPNLQLLAGDLVLLRFWISGTGNKILQMPRRSR